MQQIEGECQLWTCYLCGWVEDVELCHSDIKNFSLIKKLGVTDDMDIW